MPQSQTKPRHRRDEKTRDTDSRIITPDRRQLKKVNAIDKGRSKIVKNRVFDCHLSPDWRQMATEHTVSSDF